MNTSLLQKYISGDTNANERMEVYHWIESDEENRKAFLAQKKIYDLMLWQSESVEESKAKRFSFRKMMWELSKIAAILLIAIGSTYYFLVSHPSSVLPAESLQTVYVPVGQRAQLTLQDGTSVWLNSKTTIQFPTHFYGKIRKINIDGEAYFQVTHNEKKPFVVETARHNVTVLGTSFNVKEYKDQPNFFETSLVSGKVRVCKQKDAKNSLILTPNMMAKEVNGEMITTTFNPNELLWKDGIIYFDNKTIEEMKSQIELYYDVNLIVHNKRIKAQRFTGKFRVQEGITHLLRVLQLKTNFTIEEEKEQKTIIIQ